MDNYKILSPGYVLFTLESFYNYRCIIWKGTIYVKTNDIQYICLHGKLLQGNN